MKFTNGQYYCLSEDNHLHGEKDDGCGADFKSNNKHKFRTITSADDISIPSNKCAIQFINGGYLNLDDKKEAKEPNNGNLADGEYHFTAAVVDAGSGIVTIVNDKYNTYLKWEGHHVKAEQTADCGVDCNFILQDLSITG